MFKILIFGVQFERRKVDKKQTYRYMKTETRKLYSRVFWVLSIGVASYGALGHVPPLTSS